VTLLQAIFLGVVQGLTEFLPVSSTAHLKIAESLLGILRGDPFLTSFDVVIQLGTLVSVLAYFRKELVLMVSRGVTGLRSGKPLEDPHARLLWWVLCGSLPVGLLGIELEHVIARLDQDEHVQLMVIAFSLIIFGMLLLVAEYAGRQRRTLAQMNLVDALTIGLAQAVAIVPGVSRSGVTLTAGLFRGLRREDTARYSFILSIPAVGAAGGLKLLRLIQHHEVLQQPGAMTNLVVGTLVSALVGYGVITWFLGYLRARRTTPFVIWRLAMGALLLLR
jgi:undecaprenyl-diphosphatase